MPIENMSIDPSLMLWLVPLMLWEAVWKCIALWKAGRNNHPLWFVGLFILNTAGILPIVYLAFFQKKGENKSSAAMK